MNSTTFYLMVVLSEQKVPEEMLPSSTVRFVQYPSYSLLSADVSYKSETPMEDMIPFGHLDVGLTTCYHFQSAECTLKIENWKLDDNCPSHQRLASAEPSLIKLSDIQLGLPIKVEYIQNFNGSIWGVTINKNAQGLIKRIASNILVEIDRGQVVGVWFENVLISITC
ncbi:hypothetical protein [Anthocerotibacter panamensis]|uniref:hypothetical protein n=1 Tax=Anthocerotibacter panamensis TaxID=2857077 RepID=UPI001C4021FD|nr:hypothetical protein [Anthocerotibacter panamensis]